MLSIMRGFQKPSDYFGAIDNVVDLRLKRGDLPNRSNFAILKIGIRYLAQICSRVKEKEKKGRNDPFCLSYGGHLGFLA